MVYDFFFLLGLYSDYSDFTRTMDLETFFLFTRTARTSLGLETTRTSVKLGLHLDFTWTLLGLYSDS